MYGELGSIKEIVALSPQETLDSAAALLVQLGYEVTMREDTSLTATRRKREGMFMFPRTRLSALRIRSLILRSDSFWRRS